MLRNAFFLGTVTPTHPLVMINNVEQYTFATLFPRKGDTPPPPLHYVTLEWPLRKEGRRDEHCSKWPHSRCNTVTHSPPYDLVLAWHNSRYFILKPTLSHVPYCSSTATEGTSLAASGRFNYVASSRSL